MTVTPHLKVNDANSPVKVTSLRVDASILDSLAETTVEMTFRNDVNRVLEGELLFPLAPDQNIVGLSLYINEIQRDAVPADKAKERSAMDTVVRRQIDPALLRTANRSATIMLSEWTSNEPYANKMMGRTPSQIYQIYLEERSNYQKNPAFYLDVAKILMEAHKNKQPSNVTPYQQQMAIRILSNLVEIELDNRHVLRLLAYHLNEMKLPRLAIPLLKAVVEMASDEPQSSRDLALVYYAAGDDQKAIDHLYTVVK